VCDTLFLAEMMKHLVVVNMIDM